MPNPITAESAAIQHRAALLRDVSNAARAAQGLAQQREVMQISEPAFNLRSINTSLSTPVDPYRGRNLDITV